MTILKMKISRDDEDGDGVMINQIASPVVSISPPHPITCQKGVSYLAGAKPVVNIKTPKRLGSPE